MVRAALLSSVGSGFKSLCGYIKVKNGRDSVGISRGKGILEDRSFAIGNKIEERITDINSLIHYELLFSSSALSSAVEQDTLNVRVVGSNPSGRTQLETSFLY